MDFPSTQWSRLAEATLHGDEAAARALAGFCHAYRGPIFGYVLSWGLPREDAEDAVQSFLVHVIERSMLRRADPARGRFRSFLLGALRHFLADLRDRNTAARRGGGTTNQPLHLHEDSIAGETGSAVRGFDRDWALAILRRALAKVEAERPPGTFAAIRAFLPGGGRPPSFAEASEASGMSGAALRSEVSRVRARLRECIRAEVATTVDAPGEIDAEMAWLYEVLAGP